MQAPPGTIARPRELLLISLAGTVLAVLMTWPLATGLSHLGRTASTDADGQFSIWNIAWVSHALGTDPLHVFDANIFAPHKTTLAYSEANLLPGALGMPAWWLTHNPWLTLNVVLLLAFASAFVGAYLLLLYVSGSRPAAASCAIVYAFCPYVMSHLSHIQLLWTGGIPLSLYLLHRLVDSFRLKAEATDGEFRLKAEATDGEFRLKAEATDGEFRLKAEATDGEFRPKAKATDGEFRPKAGPTDEGVASGFSRNSDDAVVSAFRRNQRNRAILLGLALAAQALSCAYYGVFAGLMVGYATLIFATTRRLWRSAAYWTAIAIAAATALLITVPLFIPYLRVQQQTGFARTVDDTARWAARPIDYLTSAAHAHAPLLAWSRTLGQYLEVLFPGFVALVFGAIGIAIAARSRAAREAAVLYGTLGVLALWASFGPGAGLYRVLYYLPTFSFLRAPSRLGLVVALTLLVFASMALRTLLAAVPSRWRAAAGALAIAAAIGDVAVFPLRWFEAPSIPSGYGTLTRRTRAPLAEFPFYGERVAFPLHAQYMLFSTAHWLPLVNGYSDVIPLDFRQDAPALDSFPSREAFAAMARHRVRYIAVHWDMYVDRRDEIRQRLDPYLRYLNALASDDRMTIYEVTQYP